MTDYIEFSRQIKEKYPQYKDVDDLKLAKAMIEKYPVYAEQVSFDSNNQTQTQKQGIDLTPSGIPRNIAAAAVAPLQAIKDKSSLPEAYATVKNEFKTNPIYKHPVRDFVTDTWAYSMLPVANVFKGAGLASRLGNYGLTGAGQGALIGGLEGLKQEGLNNALSGVGLGTASGAAIGIGLPLGGNMVTKGLTLLPRISGKLAQLKPETVQQVTKPTSKALEMTEDKAQNLLLDTTERVRQSYNQLLNDKGRAVGNLLQELPDDPAYSFYADNLINDIDKIYDNYSLSKNLNLNPAINATKNEYKTIEKLLYGSDADRLNEFTNAVENAKFDFTPLDTVKGHYKNRFWTKSLDNINNDITRADRRMNEYIEGIKQYPEIINDPKKIQNIENAIEKFKVPDDVKSRYYEKLYEVMSKGEILDKSKKTVTPKELYDINKNISNMTRWDMPDSEIKNDILEQIYGSYAERIADLSPELEKANKVYSDLMDFKKNEGIDRILNNRQRLDNAASALKNYNSTVTKGNTNRNIQDLEKMLVDYGEQPFLSDIDDINAAMDLLKQEKTGLGSAAEIAKGALTRPVLKLARELNRRGLPQYFKNVGRQIPKYLVPLMYRGPRLYGGISNTDEY